MDSTIQIQWVIKNSKKKNKKLGENIESEELGLGEIWGEMSKYDQNVCMYEISKELIKIFILMVS